MLNIVHNHIIVPSRTILVPADRRTRSNNSYKLKHVRAITVEYITSFSLASKLYGTF